MKTTDLDSVRDHSLDSSENCAENCKEETHGTVGVITNRGHVDSQEQGQQGEIGHCAIPLAEKEDRDGNGEDWCHGPHDLMERDGHFVSVSGRKSRAGI